MKNKTLLPSGFFGLLLIAMASDTKAQVDLRTIVPLSPNAAEMVKYVDAPIDNFTGIPSIDIPLFTVQSGELSLPLSLSYHSGGNKVESVSGWVGLSWSLNSIPMISRSVNCLPDEGLGGFFTPYAGQTCLQLNEKKVSPKNNTEYTDYINYLFAVENHECDSEPDFFSFSIKGKNGKFYYSQDSGKFVCSPYSNIRVLYDGLFGFTIVSDDGTNYIFRAQDREFTTVSSTSASQPVASSWCISTIRNAARTDSIVFNYATETTSNRSLGQDIKYLWVMGGASTKYNYTGPVYQTTSQSNKRLASITFRGGSVRFVTKSQEREDLIGGHALDSVVLSDVWSVPVRRFVLEQSYLTGSATASYKNNKWMLLSGLKEVGAGASGTKSYRFVYNSENIPPSRTSLAQDYWGFYNGKYTNTSLISTTYIGYPVNANVAGANREVNPDSTQFAMLRKIIFPTGGYREFDYENNVLTNSTSVPAKYEVETASIEANTGESPEGDELPVHNEYTMDFVINNASDAQLNGGNPNGGAFVKLETDGLGVPLGSVGAYISIKGVSSTNATFNLTAYENFSERYFPNGTYRVTAVFDQNPPNYQNFFCIFSWKRLLHGDSTFATISYAGGLRIKEIRTYERSLATPIIQKYKYTVDWNSNYSSGDIFAQWYNNKYDQFNFEEPTGDGYVSGSYVRLRSGSNQAQVSHTGSYVGYKKVYVATSSPEQTGISSFSYTHEVDQDLMAAPYPPSLDYGAFRGQLTEQRDLVLKNGTYWPVRSTTLTYNKEEMDSSSLYAIKTDPDISFPLGGMEHMRYPLSSLYYIRPLWTAPRSKTERLYSQTDTTIFVETVTNYSYDIYRQPSEESVLKSNGSFMKRHFYYPYSLQLSGADETARMALFSSNSLNTVIKSETTSGASLSTITTGYKVNTNPNQILPYKEVFQINGSPLTSSILFNKYDNRGNIREQQKENDVKEVYLWGYNGQYPVAKVVGSDSATVSSKVSQATLDNSATTDAAMRTELAKIRTAFAGSPLVQVWTYTYAPLVGMTSETDPRGYTVYYEYDGFGRLMHTKDKDGNILKKYSYNYINQ